MRKSIFLILLFLIHGYGITIEKFPVVSDVEVIKLSNVTDSFQSIDFINTYTNIPVVVCTHNLSSSSEDEAAVRIDHLNTSGFDIKVQKPLNTSHTNTNVQCLVASEGTHTLENGYQFEAHSVLSTDTSGDAADGWNGTGEDVASLLGVDHGSSPAVLGQVMSYNDSDFSVFWTYNCSDRTAPPTSSDICVGKHIGQTTRDTEPRATETLGYIVVEEGSGTVRSDSRPRKWTSYKMALGSDSIDGVDNDGASYDLGYDYQIGTATLNAMDGADGGWAVFYGSDPFNGDYLDLAIDEDELGTSSNEPERSHTSEQVAYWVFEEDPGLDWMEVQKVSNVGSDWVTVNFNNSYTTPVAVCTYNLTTKNNNEAVVRVQSVQSSSMQIKLQRPIAGTDVTAGDVYCMVMEEGTHSFDGLNAEAHRVDSDLTNRSSNWSSSKMENVGYSQSYTNPVVLGQVMSYNDTDWSVFWCSDGSSKDTPPSSSSLYVGKHVGEEPVKYREDETLGFIIGAPHEGEINHIYYTVDRGADSVEGAGDSPPYSYSFSSRTHTAYSYGVATQNAEDGGNGGWAVLYGTTPVSDKIDLAIDEETVAGDTTRHHTNEQVAYWVFDPYPDVTLIKSSCVLDDPVNNTTNPKRIPGATIRYMVEVSNAGYRVAENVTVEDNLTSEFDNTTITTPKVLDGACGSCTSLSGGTDSGSANGSTVTIDFDSVDRGTSDSPSKECGYFEVQIR